MILVQNPRNLSHKTEDGRIFSKTKVLSGSFPAQFYVAVFRVTRTCREETVDATKKWIINKEHQLTF